MKLPRDKAKRDAIADEVMSASRRSIPELKFELGVGVVYEGAPPNVHYSADYDGIGARAWSALQRGLYDKLCSRRTRTPRQSLGEYLDGDVRNLTLGIVGAIVSGYDVSLGIAVPAAALIVKTGLKRFCASTPERALVDEFRALLPHRRSRDQDTGRAAKKTSTRRQRGRPQTPAKRRI